MKTTMPVQEPRFPAIRLSHYALYGQEQEMRLIFGDDAVDIMQEEGLVPAPVDTLRRLLLRGGFSRELVRALPTKNARTIGFSAAQVLRDLGMTLITKGMLERAFERALYRPTDAERVVEMWRFRICCAAVHFPTMTPLCA